MFDYGKIFLDKDRFLKGKITMIGCLRGELLENRPGQIMIDVGGVGYLVSVSETTREELPSIGNEVKVFTYMSVREDGITLYGFLTRDQQDMFMRLIGVSGVGPKGALAILSVFTVPDLKYAILSSDSTRISKAPTVGKKTAERIIIDLKDKIDPNEVLGIEPEDKDEKVSFGAEAKDAVEGLVALGYDRKASESAVKSVEGYESMNSADIIKKAFIFLL